MNGSGKYDASLVISQREAHGQAPYGMPTPEHIVNLLPTIAKDGRVLPLDLNAPVLVTWDHATGPPVAVSVL